MRLFLLDTNVISETHKLKPSLAVMQWLNAQPVEYLCTSAIVIAELRYGIIKCDEDVKKLDLTAWIETEVLVWLKGRVLEVDEDILLRWLVIGKNLQSKKTTQPTVDLLVAAVAAEKNMIVVTRDTKPFNACGIPTFNPWTGERFNGA